MEKRVEYINRFYNQIDEETRLTGSRHGQLEYATTMHYVHRFAKPGDRILEIGAGTGRYSIALAKEGYHVNAVELVKHNLDTLQENSTGIDNIISSQADATDLSCFSDGTFDVTLVFGPLYHLYDPKDIHKAIDEAIRVTKPDGYVLFAFISVYAIMYANYFYGNWQLGECENFTEDNQIRHFAEQLFTGYDVAEFERLFDGKSTEWITTAGVDGLLEPIEQRSDFAMSDADFAQFSKWYLSVAEKRELLGATNHLLYICKKKNE